MGLDAAVHHGDVVGILLLPLSLSKYVFTRALLRSTSQETPLINTANATQKAVKGGLGFRV